MQSVLYAPAGGGGVPDLIGWGCHTTSTFLGHIESRIKNLKGILRVFSLYNILTGAFAISIKVHRIKNLKGILRVFSLCEYFYWRVCHIN